MGEAKRADPKWWVLVITTFALWHFALALNAAAQESGAIIPRICADREITVITLIDDHAEIEDLPADQISNAFLALLHARAACYAGQTSEAVAQYDAILSGLGRLHIGRQQNDLASKAEKVGDGPDR
jgi:hypothetical protein